MKKSNQPNTSETRNLKTTVIVGYKGVGKCQAQQPPDAPTIPASRYK